MVLLDQVIVTIQGEGEFIGEPALLIRTRKCNLHCSFCDSKQTWNEQNAISIHDIVAARALALQIVDKCKNYKLKTLMLTGGEPSIYFDNPIYIEFILTILMTYSGLDNIEIETNGSYAYFNTFERFITTLTDLSDMVIFNISPKPESDIELVKTNIAYLNNSDLPLLPVLKIVNEPTIINIFENQLLPSEARIFIMPLTPIKNKSIDYIEYIDNCQKTIKYCIQHGYSYSPREQVWIFQTDVNEAEQII